MTEQQFKRSIEISKRLDELERVKEEIKGTSNHRLSYSYKDSHGEDCLCYSGRMKLIGTILDKHDNMIRQEIEDEIVKLKEEIFSL